MKPPPGVAAAPIAAAAARQCAVHADSSTSRLADRFSQQVFARPRRMAPLRIPRMRLAPVLVPTALVLIQTVDAAAGSGGGAGGLGGFGAGLGASFGSFSQWLNHGPGAGALVLGREDLLRVRGSLGRISDELHLILGVIDQHLEGTASSAAAAAIDDRNTAKARANFVPLPRDDNDTEPDGAAATPRPLVSASVTWIWAIGERLLCFGIFALDIGIVVGMQVFLESIGRKRGGSTIMPKKNVASAMAKANGTVHGASIPAPSGMPGRESTQRLSVLSQEELLAACLNEHWGKLAIGLSLAVLGRLPQHILNNESILCHMLVNLAVMLRWMSLVMLLIRDDMALPKREKLASSSPSPPSSPRRRSGVLGHVSTAAGADVSG